MKILLFIFLFLPFCSFAQTKENNFYRIDNSAISIPFSKTDTLAKQLAALGKTDREKVRAIFRWIAEHIDYKVRTYSRNNSTSPLFYEEPEDSNAALPPLNERVAAKVLFKKVAFCDGYARLFKTLCDHAGIQSEIIWGYARNNLSKKFAVNHTWNAVYIDNSWHLLDVTWASGFVNFANDYIKKFDESYFLTSPEQFIRDHYPEDLKWTLLNDPPIYREFSQSPFRYSGFLKAGVMNYFPARGMIEASIGDTIVVELNSKKQLTNFYVSSSPEFDTTQLAVSPITGNEKSAFRYIITPDAGEWLYVFCNEELALRYKLNLKRSVAITTQPKTD
jgi:hypothetical protein